MAAGGPRGGEGRPGWLLTFADLLLLLLGLFVLLLSTTAPDAARFRDIAWALQDALDVPRTENAPGVTSTSPLHGGRQAPISEPAKESPPSEAPPVGDKSPQDAQERKEEPQPHRPEASSQEPSPEAPPVQPREPRVNEAPQRIMKEVRQDARDLSELIGDEIAQGLISVETRDANILIRIKERALFFPVKAEIHDGFLQVIDRISASIATIPGRILVAGHTDNIPVASARFRSNWELSATRAVAVVHEMLRNGDIDPKRIVVEGRADTVPLAPNDSAEGRAVNRRVEIVVSRGEDMLPGAKGPPNPGQP